MTARAGGTSALFVARGLNFGFLNRNLYEVGKESVSRALARSRNSLRISAEYSATAFGSAGSGEELLCVTVLLSLTLEINVPVWVIS